MSGSWACVWLSSSGAGEKISFWENVLWCSICRCNITQADDARLAFSYVESIVMCDACSGWHRRLASLGAKFATSPSATRNSSLNLSTGELRYSVHLHLVNNLVVAASVLVLYVCFSYYQMMFLSHLASLFVAHICGFWISSEIKFLTWLLRVDLINKAGLNIRPYIRLSTKSLMIDMWPYAIWPDPKPRLWRSESCENGWFQSLSPLQVCK